MKNIPAITHWCRHCDSHHPKNQVSGAVPASSDGEVDVLICPTCNSYEIEELLEVPDAQ